MDASAPPPASARSGLPRRRLDLHSCEECVGLAFLPPSLSPLSLSRSIFSFYSEHTPASSSPRSHPVAGSFVLFRERLASLGRSPLHEPPSFSFFHPVPANLLVASLISQTREQRPSRVVDAIFVDGIDEPSRRGSLQRDERDVASAEGRREEVDRCILEKEVPIYRGRLSI